MLGADIAERFLRTNLGDFITTIDRFVARVFIVGVRMVPTLKISSSISLEDCTGLDKVGVQIFPK